MNKDEAAKALGISRRALERYGKMGKLSVSYKRGKTGRVADYDPDEVEKLKKEIQGEKTSAVPVHKKLTLSLEEAALLSGLAREFIEKAIEQGTLKKIQDRIRREDLERFISSLSS